MNIGKIKKRIVLESSVAGGVIVALLLGLFGAITYVSHMEEEKSAKEAEVSSVKQQIIEYGKNTKIATESLTKFHTLSSDRYNAKILDRQSATEIIQKLKADYNISTLKLKIKPVDDVKQKEYDTPTVSLVYSLIELDIGAMSDESVLRFMQAVERNLPGFIIVNKLTLMRKGEISDETLKGISAGSLPELASASLSMYWFAFKPKDNKAPATP